VLKQHQQSCTHFKKPRLSSCYAWHTDFLAVGGTKSP